MSPAKMHSSPSCRCTSHVARPMDRSAPTSSAVAAGKLRLRPTRARRPRRRTIKGTAVDRTTVWRKSAWRSKRRERETRETRKSIQMDRRRNIRISHTNCCRVCSNLRAQAQRDRICATVCSHSARCCVLFSPPLGPPCVRNILGSELCERFSWYGLRAILVLYFNQSLGWSKDASISMFSYSSALAYFMPLLGGYLSDSRLGKYRTILYFSMLYVGGCTMLAVSALDRMVWLSILGLVFIGVGTGGIKPCVSSFGADQFTQRRCINAAEVAHREHEISSFFHFFYFSINLGSVGSFIVTPLLRQHFGYSVAFAVPAVLLAIATLIFWSARNTYYRSPPAGSVLTQLWHTFGVAWKRR